MTDNKPRLIISETTGASQLAMDMKYAARSFMAGDPFIVLIMPSGQKFIFVDSREIEGAKRHFNQDNEEVVNIDSHYKTLIDAKVEKIHHGMIAKMILRDMKIWDVLIHEDLPTRYAEYLRKIKHLEPQIRVETKAGAFFEERMIKTPEEVGYIREVQEINETVMRFAIKVIKDSQVRNEELFYENEILTSERLRNMVDMEFYKKGCVCSAIIIACGEHAANIHEEGSGPLKTNETIVMDFFPQSKKTGYWGDMTRTVIKRGDEEIPMKIIYMYESVRAAQKKALSLIKSGVSGRDIQTEIERFFENLGYPRNKDTAEGFVHGLGHGVGLHIHEKPGISQLTDYTLEPGNVVTVEPGLYSKGSFGIVGGVRIEDLVVVTKDGYENLNTMSTELGYYIL